MSARRNERSAVVAAWVAVICTLVIALCQWLWIDALSEIRSDVKSVLQRVSYIEGALGDRRAQR